MENKTNKTTEEWYQEFKKQGFDHQQAREMAFKAFKVLQNTLSHIL